VAKNHLKEAREGFEKWMKLACYVAGFWFLLDIIRYLPTEIADRVIESLLKRLGI